MSSGIGRAVKSPNQHDDIFIFGYACKLFRDDSKALFVDRGEALIPWMGDPNQPIDRYDGRATIHNLKPFESLKDNLEPKDYLTEEEIAIEAMCEEERYRSILLEEDFVDPEKDEGKEGAAIGFNYDQANQQSQQNSALAPTVFAQEEPEPPSLRTLANVLEKTADFIAKNGAQLEILMRAKEAGNLKFQFLNPDNPYNQFYKQVLEQKRERNKNPYLYNQQLANQNELSLEEVEASLRQLTRNLPSAAPNPTTSDGTSSPSYGTGNGGSAYSKLVEKIRENRAEAAAKEATKISSSTVSSACPSESTTPVPSPVPPSSEQNICENETNSKTSETNDNEPNDSVIEVVPPPLDIQTLIDKTASWVSKENLKNGNEQAGAEKLSVVKKLHKDRFEFLFPESKYHNYYLFKIALYTEMTTSNKEKESKTEIDKPVNEINQNEESRNSTSTANTVPQDDKQMAELTIKTFPTLKGFFNT